MIVYATIAPVKRHRNKAVAVFSEDQWNVNLFGGSVATAATRGGQTSYTAHQFFLLFLIFPQRISPRRHVRLRGASKSRCTSQASKDACNHLAPSQLSTIGRTYSQKWSASIFDQSSCLRR